MSFVDSWDGLSLDPDNARRFVTEKTSEVTFANIAHFGSLAHSDVLTHLESASPFPVRQAIMNGFDDWRRSIVEPHERNAVFVDTTTLYTVAQLIQNERAPLSPSTLFDLANFVQCCVLFDRIFHLPNEDVPIQELSKVFGQDIFCELTIDDLSITDHTAGRTASEFETLTPGQAAAIWLESVFNGVRRDAAETRDAPPGSPLAKEAEYVLRAWQQVFNERLDGDAIRATNWISTRWSSMAPNLLRHVIHGDDIFKNGLENSEIYRLIRSTDTNTIISEANFRAKFNFEISRLLKLPYSPNSYRTPYQNAQYRRATHLQSKISILPAIEKAYREYRESYHVPQESPIDLPLFLSAVIASVTKPSEIPGAVRDLREELASLRASRTELDDALRNNRPREIERLRRAVAGEYKRSGTLLALPMVCSGTAAVLASATAGLPSFALVGLFLLAAAPAALSDLWDQIQVQLLRPSYIHLGDVVRGTDQMVGELAKIQQIWAPQQSDSFQFLSARLKHLRLEPF